MKDSHLLYVYVVLTIVLMAHVWSIEYRLDKLDALLKQPPSPIIVSRECWPVMIHEPVETERGGFADGGVTVGEDIILSATEARKFKYASGPIGLEAQK